MDSSTLHKLRVVGYVCAPAALILAIVLCRETPGFHWDQSGFSRQVAIQRAGELLVAAGLDPSQYQAAVTSQQDADGLSVTVRRIHSGLTAPALAPPYRVKVRFMTGRGKEESADVTFDPSGRLLGYDLPESARPLERGAQAARFAQRFGGFNLGIPTEKGDAEDPLSIYSFTDPTIPEIRHSLRLTPRSMKLETDSSRAGAQVSRRWPAMQKAVGEVAKLLLFVATLYALRLFGRRYRDREIPMARALLLLSVMTLLGASSFLLNADRWLSQAESIASAIPIRLMLAAGAVSLFAAGGLLLGGTYAATEGELREGCSGKLIGVDAILSGRYFSRQSGVAVLDGYSIAIYAFFLACLFNATQGQWLGANAAEHIERLYSRAPALSILTVVPLTAVWGIVAGLLIPLAFLHRNRRWKKLEWLLLTAVPFLVTAGLNDESMLTAGTVVETLLWTGVLVAAFRVSGVAAVFTGVTLYSFLIDSAGVAVLQPEVRVDISLLIAGVVLAPFIFAAWRGPEVTDEQVRPHYAGLLAQRIALRAKVEAAREAQTRLRPKGLPKTPGIEVSAICHAAGFAGGDFFDFFPLPLERQAVLVTSGSGPGLPATLTIALAKGFFRCILPYSDGPAPALEGFRREFAHLLGSAEGRAGLALVFLDARSQSAEIARLGPFPQLWRIRRGEAEPVSLTGQSPVHSGTVALARGEALLIHTRGLTELLEDQSEAGHRGWLSQTARHLNSVTAAALEDSLRVRLWGKKRKQPKGDLPADLTVLAITLDSQAALAQPVEPAKEHAS